MPDEMPPPRAVPDELLDDDIGNRVGGAADVTREAIGGRGGRQAAAARVEEDASDEDDTQPDDAQPVEAQPSDAPAARPRRTRKTAARKTAGAAKRPSTRRKKVQPA